MIVISFTPAWSGNKMEDAAVFPALITCRTTGLAHADVAIIVKHITTKQNLKVFIFSPFLCHCHY
jgi:hypothetical protein